MRPKYMSRRLMNRQVARSMKRCRVFARNAQGRHDRATVLGCVEKAFWGYMAPSGYYRTHSIADRVRDIDLGPSRTESENQWPRPNR